MRKKIKFPKYTPALIWCWLSFFLAFPIQAETDIDYQNVGNFMGSYMCRSLIEKQVMTDDEIMAEFAVDLVAKYGEEQTIMIMNKVEEAFNKEQINSNDSAVDLMRGLFQAIIGNDDCFKVFITEEVFE